jgi:hypothetical protein
MRQWRRVGRDVVLVVGALAVVATSRAPGPRWPEGRGRGSRIAEVVRVGPGQSAVLRLRVDAPEGVELPVSIRVHPCTSATAPAELDVFAGRQPPHPEALEAGRTYAPGTEVAGVGRALALAPSGGSASALAAHPGPLRGAGELYVTVRSRRGPEAHVLLEASPGQAEAACRCALTAEVSVYREPSATAAGGGAGP